MPARRPAPLLGSERHHAPPRHGHRSDLRERGTSDDELKKLVTPENYERYKKIARPQCEAAIKGNLAIQAVGAAQGLSVPQNELDDEVMMMQAQALQRGEKFKESEVRGRTHSTVHTADGRVLESAQGAQHVLTPSCPPWSRCDRPGQKWRRS